MLEKLVIILLFSSCALASSKKEAEQWHQYKVEHSKEYTAEQEIKRFQIWRNNVAMVERHNEEAEQGLHGYRMAINKFSDLTDDEFESTMLGYLPETGDESEVHYFQVRATPDEVDYRDEGLVTPVKNQGHCGSCWAFSATGGIEGVWAKKVGELISVSEQQLLDCGPGSCNGGNMGKAWDTAKGGVMTEEDYPYEHEEKECRFNANQAVSSVTGHHSVHHGDEEQLEQALVQIGYPVSIAVRASSTFRHYSSGVYDDVGCIDDGNLNHAILVVGYHKTNPDNEYWIVKNSWGANWGKQGYIKMRMSKNICGMAERGTYPTLNI